MVAISFFQKDRPPEDLITKRLLMDDDDFFNKHHKQWSQYNWQSDILVDGHYVATMYHQRCTKNVLISQIKMMEA